MIIHYHKIAGRIGMSEAETGTRGAWLEKRKALWSLLRQRGHKLECLTKPTRPSVGLWSPLVVLGGDLFSEDLKADILMLEFGGSNGLFFGGDLKVTFDHIRKHQGPVVFVCDDPDLFFPWKQFSEENWSRWVMWVNAMNPEACPRPAGVKAADFPIASVMPAEAASTSETDMFVYSGRPSGRREAVAEYISGRRLVDVYGKQQEWDDYGVKVSGPSPKQSERKDFYRHKLGCLGLSDSKHKKLGWRTGRAYHAAASGCPAVVQCDSPLSFPKVSSAGELDDLRKEWLNAEARKCAHELQVRSIAAEKELLLQTMEAAGL